MNWIKTNWERGLLYLASLLFLVFSVKFLVSSDITGATATFVMFFLCLIYANVSRFKRFKGFGVEAELWEDKQKEAASLIDRLTSIVQVYTREIVLARVMAGRFSGGAEWPNRWALYEELVDQHDTLGQTIDFLPLKEKVYRVMVFDAVQYLSEDIRTAIRSAYLKARERLSAESGNPTEDPAGLARRRTALKKIDVEMPDLFEISEEKNVARYVLDLVDHATEILQAEFGISVELPEEDMARLRKVDELFEKGDFHPDAALMRWADHLV